MHIEKQSRSRRRLLKRNPTHGISGNCHKVSDFANPMRWQDSKVATTSRRVKTDPPHSPNSNSNEQRNCSLGVGSNSHFQILSYKDMHKELQSHKSISAALYHDSILYPYCRDALNYTFNSKVVPKSVVNPDFLEPFNCKGLFTTHAITRSPLCLSLVKTTFGRMLTAPDTLELNNVSCRFTERNSGPGLIGIGLVPRLRTLSQLYSNFMFIVPVVIRSALILSYYLANKSIHLLFAGKPKLRNLLHPLISLFKSSQIVSFQERHKSFLSMRFFH